MSIKTALTTFVLTIAVALTSSQLVSTVSAVDSPLTPPITAPVTPPETDFDGVISGKITIKKIGWWKGFSNRFLPADNVLVKLVNIKTNDVMTTTTDANGVYAFDVDKGFYKVSPKFGNHGPDIVVPPFQFVTLKKHDKMHVDFHALDLP